MSSIIRITALVLLCAAGMAHADQPLQLGQSVAISLPASNFASNYYIDVDGSAKTLKVSVAGNGGDVDLFVRYATPFPEQDPNVDYPTVSYDLLNHYGQYHSISSTSNESVTVLPSDRFPLQAGRWYIALINGGSTDASVTLSATTATAPEQVSINIDFANPRTDPTDATNDCDDTFWNDTTAATPVGGNPGTTLGAQRKNALTYATQQLVQQLGIPYPITVHACGAHLGGTSTSAVIAHAAPLAFFYDEPTNPIAALPSKYTWYPGTVAVRLSGTGTCGVGGGPCDGVNNEEIEATFNEDIGQSNVVGGETFYLGYDSNAASGSLDFITIAMHEMTHGLGFIGLINLDSTQGPVGAKPGVLIDQSTNSGEIVYQDFTEGPFDDIYDNNVAIVNQTTKTYTPFMGYEVTGSRDAARAAAVVTGPTVTSAGQYIPGLSTGIRWSDAVAANASVNINAAKPAPDDFPSLYAPCDESKTTTCVPQPSSTLSHTIQSGDMMNAYYTSFNLRSMGLAVPMLSPVGWSNAATTMPTFATPIPSNWYDRTHSGHGFDFQLAGHDAVNGDVYFLTFYTYTDAGVPEWYQAVGRLVDGVFLGNLDQNGNTMYRVIYNASPTAITSVAFDPNVAASVMVDFNQAANAPACRNANRTGSPMLGVMTWSIGTENGSWCVQPIVTVAEHAAPDYNGHWYAPSDSGWGFELLDIEGSPDPTIIISFYFPGAANAPTWALGSGTLHDSTATLQLQQISNGFCRTCTPPASLTENAIGTMTLTLDGPNPAFGYTTGHATVQASFPGGSFTRTNIPISMLSVPTGQ